MPAKYSSKEIMNKLNEIGEMPKSDVATCDDEMVASMTTIVVPDFAGYGDDYFNDKFSMVVILNTELPGSAPEGEERKITDYVSDTGTFTVEAFSSVVECGYFVGIVDNVLSDRLDTIETKIDSIITYLGI